MKTLFRSIALLILFLTISMASFAQGSAVATASTTATIITPISITKSADMNFGDIAVGAVGGTVTLSTAGVVSHTGTDIATPSTGATRSQAIFAVAGQASSTYTIVITNSTVVLSGTGADMNVSTFILDPGATGTLDGSGDQTVNIGATLTVAGSQTAGAYTNADDLEVTVAYN